MSGHRGGLGLWYGGQFGRLLATSRHRHRRGQQNCSPTNPGCHRFPRGAQGPPTGPDCSGYREIMTPRMNSGKRKVHEGCKGPM
ncbi:hypothetical protein DB31_8358 [Hyalangium minutum]|uniref:Uncharacterized protein n=1 Tax=Hyalangium minutum TaxID=394096 RepID=A0A085WH42_9BACT|nr:hypothetical protein DB31_8358 [Hyalangium minutum]